MERDKDLIRIFSDYRPALGDNDAFIEKLERRLEAVEYVKCIQARRIRFYKYAAVLALLLGVVGGVALATLVPALSDVVPHIAFGTESVMLLFLERHFQDIMFVVLATALSGSILLLLNLLQLVVNDYLLKGRS